MTPHLLDDPALRASLGRLETTMAELERRLSAPAATVLLAERPRSPRALATGPIKAKRASKAITGSLKPMPPLPETPVDLQTAEGGFLDAFARHEADYAEPEATA